MPRAAQTLVTPLQTDERVTIGRYENSLSFFAYCLFLLASPDSDPQHSLTDFAAACDFAEMKIFTFLTDVLHLSKNLVQCPL